MRAAENCYCDDRCKDKGDCCDDFEEACPVFAPTVTTTTPCKLLPPSKRSLGQGDVFTPVCHSVDRGGWLLCIHRWSCDTLGWLPSMHNVEGW